MDNMNTFYNKHYITIDSNNVIINGFSDGFRQPEGTDICINEQGGYQFRLFPDGEENPQLSDFIGIHLYKYIDGIILLRTDEDKQPEITQIENQNRVGQLKSQLNDIDMKTIRPQRAILAGTGTAEDTQYLKDLEAQAQVIRTQIQELEGN